MVVSLESQKIHRKSYARPGRSSIQLHVAGKPVPLYLIPFITALFIFSTLISLFDPIWQPELPDFRLGEMTFPVEPLSEKAETVTLMAYAPDLVRENMDRGLVLQEYTVGPEDRYSVIARKFGISIDTLISANRLKNGDILPGEVLKIPGETGIFYSVEKGDTLTSIASYHGVEVEEIKEINRLFSTVIHVDERIFIPGASLSEEELDRVMGENFLIPAAGNIKNTYGSYTDSATGLKEYNYGIDIVNMKGTPVYAARSGTVGTVSFNAFYGRVVQINHSGSMESLYSSLDSAIVKPGEIVQRGQLIGYMGNSGFRGGEHLQFSIFRNKEDVDTLEFIF